MRAFVLGLVLLLGGAAPLTAQYPAELSGRVLERGSARPIEGAAIELDARARATTDAAGVFALRSDAEGSTRVRITRPGYAPMETTVTLESGRTTTVVYVLDIAPIEIAALSVEAEARRSDGIVFSREAIERSGARTLGELVRAVPGVVVRESSGAGERVSIRGSGADQVLVLVDGVPANDALSGEADLSLIPLHDAAAVEVLPGARSAERGGRAQAGVISVRTRRARDVRAAVSLRAGSLGTAGGAAEAGTSVGALAMAAGVRVHRVGGRFDFERPESLGGGTATRLNVSERELGGFMRIGAGALRVGADHAHAERGLPGPVHAPTTSARQSSTRSGLTAGWSGSRENLSVLVDANVGWQRLRVEDPEPAFGSAYFDTTRARDLGVRGELEHAAGARVPRVFALGAEMRTLRIESSSLDPRTVRRSTPALFVRGAVDLPLHASAPRLGAALRADRWAERWLVSHDLSLRASSGRITLDAAHRSAFSPPTAADQFFAGGVGVAPNPDLEPERVRSELELGLSAAFAPRGVPVTLGVRAFTADVDGMIVWAPDFRFVWSPRNRDVHRAGGEAWSRVSPHDALDLTAWVGLARVTYDWPGDGDTIQVAYRPRHTAGLTADWHPGAWLIGAEALYTGVRYATPGRSNPLPGYWDVRATIAHEWQRGAALVRTSVRVERLLNNTDSFIHGYPEAGRRLVVELGIRRAERTFPVTASIDR